MAEKLAGHVPIDRCKVRFREQSLANAGLIADDNDVDVGSSEQLQGFYGSRNELKIFDPMHVALLDINRAIAVQENCTNRHLSHPARPVVVSTTETRVLKSYGESSRQDVLSITNLDVRDKR